MDTTYSYKMKKSLIAAAILLAGASSSAQAIVGAKAGYNYWFTSSHGNVHNGYVQLEHFVPLVPNAALRYSSVDSNKLELDSIDAYGYYRLFDNSNLALDVGFGLRRLSNGKLDRTHDFSTTMPMLNADVTLFQDSDIAYYTKLDMGRNGHTSFNDFELGVRVYVFAGARLQAGYRHHKLELDGTKGLHSNERLSGFNLGVHWQI